jgi:hypothetical protein
MFGNKKNTTNKTPLMVEPLERRDMLSAVTVMASGDMGGEFFDVQIDGVSAEVFRTTQEMTEFRFDTTETVTADQVRIQFSGDLHDPANGVDTNLNVDFITIDGRKFETEATNTFATGVWDADSSSISEGFFETEKLVSNGYFDFGQYPSSTYDSTIIEIDAAGSGGDGEIIELQIRGETVASYVLSDNPFTGGFDGPTQFSYKADGIVTADDIRIAFNNDDVYQQNIKGYVSTVDRNLTVDSVTVAGQKYYTDSDAVYSTGVWDSDAGGAVAGFGKGNTLHTNGYFQFNSNVSSTTIVVDTSTARGVGERYDLQIDGVTVAQTVLSDNPFQAGYQGQTELVFEAPAEVSISDIRIVFTNDGVTTQNLKGFISTVDRNLTINAVTVDGETFLTNDASVFSTGIWDSEQGGPRPGLGLGDTLHVNGYFQYGRG